MPRQPKQRRQQRPKPRRRQRRRAKAKAAARAKWKRATSAGPLAAKTAKIAAAARTQAVKASTKAARDKAKVITAMRSRKVAKAKLAVAVKKRKRVAAAKKAVHKATRKAKKAKAKAKKSSAKAAKAKRRLPGQSRGGGQGTSRGRAGMGWSPRNRTVFNNPKGSRRHEHAIIAQLATAIDATPVSGEIWMAQFLFDIPALTTKLIAAHRRGAYVRILIDSGERGPEIRRVAQGARHQQEGAQLRGQVPSQLHVQQAVQPTRQVLPVLRGRQGPPGLHDQLGQSVRGERVQQLEQPPHDRRRRQDLQLAAQVLHRHARRSQQRELLPRHGKREVHDLHVSAQGSAAQRHRGAERAQHRCRARRPRRGTGPGIAGP